MGTSTTITSSKKGQPWTDEEDMELTSAFLSFLDERMEKHGRTEYAIISRLERLMSSKVYGFIKTRLEERKTENAK